MRRHLEKTGDPELLNFSEEKKQVIQKRLRSKLYFGHVDSSLKKVANQTELADTATPFVEEEYPKFAVDYVKQHLFPDEFVSYNYLHRES